MEFVSAGSSDFQNFSLDALLVDYNRRAHIRHTTDIPGAPSSGDQVDYATGHHRTQYIRPLYQDCKTFEIHLKHRNKHRELAKMGKQINMPQMKEQGNLKKKQKTKLNEMEAIHQ